MLLNSDELIGFVHLPSSEVRSQVLERDAGKTKAAPPTVRQTTGILLGENIHAGETVQVRLTPERRVQHTHIIGASGTGKSTLLFNLIREDIENGQGLGVLDPHGDLIDRICGIIPANRIDDVVLVDPSDEECSVGFNILSAHSELEKNLLASDLVAVFERLSTSWGDQMNSVLQNAILAFLESKRGGTIADLRRFLIEPAFRKEFLESVPDAEVVYYWQKSFPQLVGNRSIGSILTRLDSFLSKKPIRHMVAQPANRLDFAQIMDTGKIFLAKLPEGLLGRANSYLLGTLLVSKFQQIAMSRQAQRIAMRKDFWIYIDEFANFITPSMAEILSGARKYRIGLTLAHHELHQLDRDKEVASAVMAHPSTRIVFRVSDDDARKLSDGLSHFEAKDLRNLEVGQAICRVERSDYDFNLNVLVPSEPDRALTERRHQEVIAASRQRYGTPRRDVEALLAKSTAVAVEPRGTEAKKAPPQAAVLVPSSTNKPAKNEAPAEKAPRLPEVVVKPTDMAPRKSPTPGRSRASEPRDLGRGGAQHKAIQKRLKAAAEKAGFRGGIEKEILDGQGSVDLLLERDDMAIACEISISTTIDHEVGNVAKCLKAGFGNVAVISLDEEHLQKISAAVSGSLGAGAAGIVEYYHPDRFIARLESFPPLVPKALDEPILRRGYKVSRKQHAPSKDEQKHKEETVFRIMTDEMQRKTQPP